MTKTNNYDYPVIIFACKRYKMEIFILFFTFDHQTYPTDGLIMGVQLRLWSLIGHLKLRQIPAFLQRTVKLLLPFVLSFVLVFDSNYDDPSDLSNRRLDNCC